MRGSKQANKQRRYQLYQPVTPRREKVAESCSQTRPRQDKRRHDNGREATQVRLKLKPRNKSKSARATCRKHMSRSRYGDLLLPERKASTQNTIRTLPVVRSMIDDGGWWVVGGWDPGRTRLRRAQEAGRGSCMKLSTDYVEGER